MAEKAENANVLSHVQLNLRYVSLLLVLIGIGVSGYLSYVELADAPIICTVGEAFECDVVRNSAYAEVFSVPVAYLGLASYLFIGGLLLLEERSTFLKENGVLLTFGIVLFAFLYSMYLVYVQGVVLEAWCQWCVMHEITMTVLFIVTAVRLWQALAE